MRLATITFALLCAQSALAKAPILAVMPIADRGGGIEQTVLEGLTAALRTNLATSRFRVVDKSSQAKALRKLVKQLKRDSYRACHDRACQIPLGRALAADTILQTTVSRVGGRLLINAELVDLAREASAGAAQVRVPAEPRAGRDDRLLDGVLRLAKQLAGAFAPTASQPTTRDAEDSPARPAAGPAPAPSPDTDEHEAAAAAAQKEPDPGQDDPRAGYRALGWVMVGVAAAGAAGSIFAFSRASSAAESANTAGSPAGLQDAANAHDTWQPMGWILGGLGVAAATTATILLLKGRSAPGGRASSTPSVAAGPIQGGGAVVIRGAF